MPARHCLAQSHLKVQETVEEHAVEVLTRIGKRDHRQLSDLQGADVKGIVSAPHEMKIMPCLHAFTQE